MSSLPYRLFIANTVTPDSWLGRNGGDDLELGTHFTARFSSKLVLDGDDAWTELTYVGATNLVVEAIKLSDDLVDWVAAGFVCELRLSGDLDSVTPGCILGDENTAILHRQRTRP